MDIHWFFIDLPRNQLVALAGRSVRHSDAAVPRVDVID